ncbi:MAG: redox-regulated ATPase YchF [Patescibacteria group bacterium]|nr:redox-regulated ATPase YchF [Patescibacteria group bacterium]
MGFSVGIVGLPNVGKSTLFKALTKKQVEIANYPFTTIKENVGVVKVPDERLEKLAEVLKPKEIIPTHIEFIDIAGLVKGAHKGEGLGNQFLAKIREVDLICHLLRSFESKNVPHPSGEINPKSDLEVIDLELMMADLATLEKRLEKIKKEARSGEKKAMKELEILEKIKEGLVKGVATRNLNLTPEEKEEIQDLNLLTIKPVIYVLNISEEDISETKFGLGQAIPICAKLEAELAELSPEEEKEYLASYGLKRSQLDNLIVAAYQTLNLITFFTCQNQILQAWTIEKGTKAPEAAGKIHTDFAKGFIKAEVINWQDLVKVGSEHLAREKGLMRIEGKDYLVQDGDVIHFRFH